MAQAEQGSWIDRLWAGIAGRARAREAADDVSRAEALAEALLSERGEASGAALARELCHELEADGDPVRLRFLRFLAGEAFAPDAQALRTAAEAWLAQPDAANAARLQDAAEPPRQELLRRANMAPGGTALLVRLRALLLAHLKEMPQLGVLDHDLQHLLGSWFNRGFLELRRIDWNSPASVLEKLIRYEAVHEIAGWDDLRRRLEDDRRCFAFFHPAMPGEPLIFVEVALTRGLAGQIQPLLAAATVNPEAEPPDTAIFYSISNCQEGLRGVSFGNLLIKQVVEELRAEHPALRRFATLSPVPGFSAWLAREAPPLLEEERARLAPLTSDEADPLPAATAGEWWRDPAREAALRPVLLRLCAEYLTRPAEPGTRIDPVAKFHLGNGARLERIHWLGNTAPRGMRESHGIMVNYLYDPPSIEANHEAFAQSGTIVRSAEVDALRGRARRPREVEAAD